MRQLLIVLMLLPSVMGAQTLEECQQAAERNYPLIRQYDLIARMTDLTVEHIQKEWLPKINAQAQATYQSDVTAWPEQMRGMMRQMGMELAGLKKDQYRIGVDVSQTIYDGGTINRQKEIAKKQGEVQTSQTAVSLYQIRKRVNDLYFGVLLLDEQIQLNHDLQELLSVSEKKLGSMFKNGTAAESDYHAVKAERLAVIQQMTGLQSERQAWARMLSTFCGIEVTAPSMPSPSGAGVARSASPIDDPIEGVGRSMRPELRVIDAQLRLADAQEKALAAALLPKLGVFAQGYYGYPGLNMFNDMLHHQWSLNGVIGARLTWNVGALYTRKNDKARIQLQREMAENQRDVFLFGNNLEQIQQRESIERYRKQMADDEQIIALRSSVRKAAESKLAHGIIDVNDLVREVNAENAAKLQQSIHKIKMMKEIYDLRYTTSHE